MERLDTAFDVFEQSTTHLMQLLNESLNLSNESKNCKRILIQGKTTEELKYEALRFGNGSYVYNVYVKLIEVFDKAHKTGRTVTPEELKEVRGILRIERQNHIGGIKKLCPTLKAGELLKADVRNNILETMTDEIGIFFGKNDYCNDDKMKGIYARVVAEYPRPPSKRQYSTFPRPCRTGDGRFKATITLYSAGSGRKKIQVAGKTVEDYENKVLHKLIETYLINRIYLRSNDTEKRNMVQKSADSVKRFIKVSKTAVRQEAEDFIESAIQIDEERYLDSNLNS